MDGDAEFTRVPAQDFEEGFDQLLREAWHSYQEYMFSSPTNLSAHQLYFLRFLAQRQSCTPSDVAREFGITLAAVTGFIDRLQKQGLVFRRHSETDRRLVLLYLTKKGEESLQEFALVRREKLAKLRQNLGAETVNYLQAGLKTLIEGLNSVNKANDLNKE